MREWNSLRSFCEGKESIDLLVDFLGMKVARKTPQTRKKPKVYNNLKQYYSSIR